MHICAPEYKQYIVINTAIKTVFKTARSLYGELKLTGEKTDISLSSLFGYWLV